MQDEKSAGGVQSAEVALRLLRVLAENGGDVSLSRLALAAAMPAAKAHRYVVSLQRAGFIAQAGRSANYALGGETLRAGLVALARLDVVDLGTDAAAALRDRTGKTVLLAIWGDHGPTIVRWFEPSDPVTINVRVGSVMPLLSSATGQVFGAWMPWERVTSMVSDEIAARDVLQSVDAANDLFARVRQTGMSAVSGSMLPGIHAVGAPVFKAAGDLAAALTVLGTDRSFDSSPRGDVATALTSAAKDLSYRIGAGTSGPRGERKL